MDDNKLHKLRDIGYAINKCCGICIHGNFKLHTDWGVCSEHDYEHRKHIGGEKGSDRSLSIHRYGSCKLFSPRGEALMYIDHFKEFYE